MARGRGISYLSQSVRNQGAYQGLKMSQEFLNPIFFLHFLGLKKYQFGSLLLFEVLK